MNTEELREAYGSLDEKMREWVESCKSERAARIAAEELENKRFDMNSYERVREFHETFGHPVADKPVVPADDRTRLRLSLILEEALELADAMGFFTQEVREYIDKMVDYGPVVEGDLIGIADALGDLDYVVNGAALEHGIDLPVVTAEIHRSNMTKLGPDGKPIYREDGKILKGEGYEPPQLEKILGF